MSNRQKEEDTIKRQITDNLDRLNLMKPVATIYDELNMGNSKGQYHKWIVDKLASTGYQVERKGFGRITFTPKQLNAGINYVNDKSEMAAFLAIPKVLKQGIEIREHDNHKSRGVETVTFSAPVEINGKRGNVAVVVKLTKDYFKALRILTTEGKVYSLSGYEKTEPTPMQRTPKNDTQSASISSDDANIPYSSTESKTKYSAREREAAEDVRTAEEYFGTTYEIAKAGYLLTDGKLLDFSGRRDGARGGYRTVDHREISDAFDGDYGDGSYSGSMVKFMQGGNIRLMPETGGINLSVKPNAQQLSTLDRYISSFRGEVMLDIDNADGRTVVSIEYPRRTYSKRVIEDINNYFDKGIIPEQPSDLGQFRYSMRDNLDAEYMEAVNTGDTETAQRLVDEAAEDALEESEVRDANGLTAVYHATYNSFTVFERKRLGQNTTGFASDNFVEATAYLGFWFNTQDLSNTVSYAGARGMKCFLNITNPYRTNTQYLAREIENDWNEELSVKENADDYVDYLKRNGYDGIILKDFEFGGTSFVAFDSEQIKSAEAITYDDKGNVIPLSERFNKSDSDIRYSMRDNLKDDLEKVKKRQFDFQNSEVLIGETSDFLVNEIGFRPLPFYMPATKAYRAIVTEEQAKKDGQPTGGSIHYHGLGVDGVYNILARAETPTAAYVSTEEVDNKRDNRIVLVTDVNVNGGLGVVVVEPNTMAQERGGRRAANKTITLFDRQSVTGAVQKAYDQGRLLYIDKKSGQRFDSGRRGSNRPSAISEDVRERNIQQFWENVKWRELNNSGIFSAGDMTNSTMAEAFRRAEGKAKYSMRDNAIADTPEQRREREMSYADLKRRNAELERRAEYWKAQTKETQQATVRKADTDKLARRIVQELGVTDRETISKLKDELKRLGDQIVQSTGAELSYNELKERALDMADELLGNISVQLDNTNEDALIRLRGYLSSTKLRMNEREMADLPEGWRRKHRRIKLSKDGVPVDTAYMELQEMFGEGTFPAYITAQADMLQQIAESKTIFSCLSVRHIAIHSFLCYNS